MSQEKHGVISSKAAIARATEFTRHTASLITSVKGVQRAMENKRPILDILAQEGCLKDVEAQATALEVPVLFVATRSELGHIVGVASLACCAPLPFDGVTEQLPQLLRMVG